MDDFLRGLPFPYDRGAYAAAVLAQHDAGTARAMRQLDLAQRAAMQQNAAQGPKNGGQPMAYIVEQRRMSFDNASAWFEKVRGKKLFWTRDPTAVVIPMGQLRGDLGFRDSAGRLYNAVNGFNDDGSGGFWAFRDPMDAAMLALERQPNPYLAVVPKKSETKKEGGKPMKAFREYLESHRDALFTVGVVLLVDQFVFGGAFRERLKALVEKLLAGAERKLLPSVEAPAPAKKE